MKSLISILAVCLLVFVGTHEATAQKTQKHRIYFENLDGFSGYVDFVTSREGFATQLRARDAVLVLDDYDCSREERDVLKAAGINFWEYGGYKPKKFGIVIKGKAFLIDYGYAINDSKLQLSNSLGDFTTPEFDSDTKQSVNEWQKKNGESYWEKYGSFEQITVVELYLSDLKNEIDKIISKNNQEETQFDNYILKGTFFANAFNIEAAEVELSKADALTKENRKRKKDVSRLRGLIDQKKWENETDKTEKELKVKKKSSATSMGVNEIMKGDVAYNQGDFVQATKHYDMAKQLGVRVDEEKYNDASAKGAGQSLAELVELIPEATADHNSLYIGIETSGFWDNQFRFGIQGRAFFGNTFFIPYGLSASFVPSVKYDYLFENQIYEGIEDKNGFGMQLGLGMGFALFNDEDFSIYFSGQGILGEVFLKSSILEDEINSTKSATLDYYGIMPSIGLRIDNFILSFSYSFNKILSDHRVYNKETFGNVSFNVGITIY